MAGSYRVQETVFEDTRTRILRAQSDSAQWVIIKTIPSAQATPSQRARLAREYGFCRRLTDANVRGIVPVLELDIEKHPPRIIFEDVGGQTLQHRLRDGGLSLAQVVALGARLADTLSEVHRQHLVHKDVKPTNVLVSANAEEAWLLDFGVASSLDTDFQQAGVLERLEGSLPYMSPEQTGRVSRPVDPRSDLYSLGVTLYEAATGQLPFPGRDPVEIIHGHVARAPQAPATIAPAVPAVLSEIILKLLAKRAELRYQSARGLARDLRRCLQSMEDGREVPPFALGEQDWPERFLPSQRLYGRDAEIATLSAAFDRAVDGSNELLFVFGFSGIGKTALVNELQRPVVERRGRFVQGKFDQFKRNLPYASLIQALRALVGQLLTESETKVAEWRERLSQSLGGLASVLVPVVPELETILGPQPLAPELDPDAARNRLLRAFGDVIGALARAEQPLVLFLDDLQWADQGSLDVLRLLATRAELRHVLIIGSYRDNEVNDSHPLTIELARLREARRFDELRLGELSRDEVRYFVVDSVGQRSEAAFQLADLILEKTRGNPFFAHMFLRSLVQQGLITLDADAGWSWDLPRIGRQSITDNVVEMLLQEMQGLPDSTQRLLGVAACLGTAFDYLTLEKLCSEAPGGSLWRALSAGFIEPQDESYGLILADGHCPEGVNPRYQFLHDRVQQAAYSLLSPTARLATHLEIARALLDNLSPELLEERRFDVADHLCHVVALVVDRDERWRFASFLLDAGGHAKQAAAYQPAIRYLNAALVLLGDEVYSDAYAIGMPAQVDLATCEYIDGQPDAADRRFAEVSRHARTDTERAKSYVLRVQLHLGQSQVMSALELAVEGLSFCGERLELRPDQAMVGATFQELGEAIGGRSFDALGELPEATDPLKLAALEILNHTAAPAYYVNENLYAVLVLKMCILSARHGQSPISPMGWALYGVIMGPLLGDFETSRRTSTLAKRLQARFGRTQLVPKLCLCLNGFVDHWTVPPQSVIPSLIDGSRAGLEVGDPMFAVYNNIAIAYIWLLCGAPLEDLDRDSRRWLAFCKGLGVTQELGIHEVNVRLSAALRGQTPTPLSLGEDEEAWLSQLGSYILRIPLHMALLAKMELALVHRDFVAGVALIERSAAEEPRSLATAHYSMHAWLTAMHVLGALTEGLVPDAERALRIEQIQAQLGRLRAWEAANPGVHRHKVLAIEAGLAALEGRVLDALAGYDEAIASAVEAGFTKHEAVLAETVAALYARLGRMRSRDAYLQDAWAAYSRWGAFAKVAALEAAYPALQQRTARGLASSLAFSLGSPSATTSTTSRPSASFDAWSLLKASQAIAGEIVLERLSAKLMRILLESTGAQRAVFLLAVPGENERLVVSAELHVDRAEAASPSQAFAEREDFCHGVVNYVMRSRKPVTISDLRSAGLFAADPYVQRQATAALLCAPVLHGGELRGLVYLENDLTPGAFTDDRVEIVKILTAQLAISIENARLYQHLERQARSFERFVPREFLALLGRPGVQEVMLGDAVRRDMVVLFSDIRSYTAMTEQMSAEEAFAFVNAYLSRVGPVVREHGGFIDKYIGDAIMALFPGSADEAAAAAMEMQRRLAALNAEHWGGGQRSPIRAGIGLHVGQLMLGIVGETERIEATVISDSVNTASRIEGLCKYFQAQTLISEDFLAACKHPGRIPHRRLGQVRVTGKQQSLSVYEVFGGEVEALVAAKARCVREFEMGVSRFEQGDAPGARECFAAVLAQVPDDRAARAYLDRAERGETALVAPKVKAEP